MKALLGPFVLRRLKTEVKSQLTEKVHKTEFIAMTEGQAKLYEAAVAAYRRQLAARVSADGGVEKWCKSVGARRISHIFSHLRKIAQHPLLVRSHFDDARVEEVARAAHERQLFSGNATLKKVQAELASYSDYALHVFCYNAGPDFEKYCLPADTLWSSSKFRRLRTMLPELKAAGSRPLIFSQWTSVLDVMEWLLSELGLPYVRLDGSTAVEERLATVDRCAGSWLPQRTACSMPRNACLAAGDAEAGRSRLPSTPTLNTRRAGSMAATTCLRSCCPRARGGRA